MTKIDIDYVKELFEYVKKNESVHAPHKVKPSEPYDAVHRGLGKFLDTICVYADSKEVDIPETIGTEQYTENRYYYNIRYGKTVLEIGAYYDYDAIYVKEAKDFDEEYVIDCEIMIKNMEKTTRKGKKRLVLDPAKENNNSIQKEDK